MTTKNILVNNLCPWPLSFRRIAGQGDIEIPANAQNFPLLSEEEVVAQIQMRNVMFVGVDGMGNHARIQIADEAKRRELFGFGDLVQEEPVLLTEDSVLELLAISSRSEFDKALNELVKTDAEKRTIVDVASRLGADDCESWKIDALRKIASTARI